MTTVDRDQLLESAKDYADRALKAYTEEDTKVVLTDAAIGLEHLCKAYLCSLAPTLLMDIKNGQLDSLLYLSGHGTKAKDPSKGPRTISGRTAVERVRSVNRTLKVPQQQITDLIDVRDGVVHVGYLGQNKTQEILTAYLRLSNELFDALQVAAEDRWGRHKELVDSLISDSLSEIERSVRHRMAAARLRVEELLARIPDSEHGSVKDARQARVTVTTVGDQETAQVECPVCKHPEAFCIGEEEHGAEVDIEPDGMGGYETSTVGGYTFLVAHSFFCGVCELDLVTPEELEAAGLETNIDLSQFEEPDFDPYDL